MVDFLAFSDTDNPKFMEYTNFVFFGNLDITGVENLLLGGDLFKTDDENPFQPPIGNELAFFEVDDVDVFLDKVYLFPVEIKAGFITEELNYEIILFSLFRVSVNVTQIDKFNFGGAILQHDPTPFEIRANSNEILDLTILKDGQPFQNSTATFYFDVFPSFGFVLVISGQRIIPFLYEPNFDTVEDNYFFETIKYIDNKGNEQRRSVSGDRSRLELSFTVLEDATRAQRFRNDLRRFGVGVVGVPFFADPLHLKVNPENQNILEIEENLEFEYNLKNVVNYVLIKNFEDDKLNEVKQILTIDDVLNEITITSPVVNSFEINESVVYPLILCYMDKPSIDRPTEDIIRSTLRFKEFV